MFMGCSFLFVAVHGWFASFSRAVRGLLVGCRGLFVGCSRAVPKLVLENCQKLRIGIPSVRGGFEGCSQALRRLFVGVPGLFGGLHGLWPDLGTR